MPSKKHKKNPIKSSPLYVYLKKHKVPALLLLVIVTVAVTALMVVANNTQANKEKKQFLWASAKITDIQTQIQKIVPSVREMQKGRRCHYGEKKGDFDKGTLHCEVSLKGTYKAKDFDAATVIQNQLGTIAYSKQNFGAGVESLTDTSDGLYFKEQNMTCGIIQYPIFQDNFEATKNGAAERTLEFTIYCDQRSHREYFPLG